jgi:hypothetical protein
MHVHSEHMAAVGDSPRANGTLSHGEARDKPLVSPVLAVLLDGLTLAYPRLSDGVGESAVYPYWNPLSWCGVEI